MLLPFWALLRGAWALGTGDLVMAPVLVGVASLIVQTHLSFVYVVGIVALTAIGAAVWSPAAPAGRTVGTADRRPSWRRRCWPRQSSPCWPGSSHSSTRSPGRATSSPWPPPARRAMGRPSGCASGHGWSPPSSPSRRGGLGPASARRSSPRGGHRRHQRRRRRGERRRRVAATLGLLVVGAVLGAVSSSVGGGAPARPCPRGPRRRRRDRRPRHDRRHPREPDRAQPPPAALAVADLDARAARPPCRRRRCHRRRAGSSAGRRRGRRRVRRRSPSRPTPRPRARHGSAITRRPSLPAARPARGLRPDGAVLYDTSVLRFAEPYSGPTLAALGRATASTWSSPTR